MSDEIPGGMPSVETMEDWTVFERTEVIRWAGTIHLIASDNPIPEPEMPEVLRGSGPVPIGEDDQVGEEKGERDV